MRALALLLLTAVSAQAVAAVSLTHGPQAQGLLFPYFTTEDGQSTLVTVHNQAETGKALKVRILESQGGRETLFFNVYLPGNASFSLALDDDPVTSGARAQVPELLCTSPIFPRAGHRLSTGAFIDVGAGPREFERTREGLIEVIEMGTLSAELSARATPSRVTDCEVFTDRWDAGIWRSHPNESLGAPSGGLRGEALVIDVAGGQSFSYAALGFTHLSHTIRHTPRYRSAPRLTDVRVPLGEDIRVNLIDDAGEPVTLRYPPERAVDAISALLAQERVVADYSIDAALAARTDWIVSFPTRRAYVDNAPGGALSASAPQAPFTSTTCEVARLTLSNARGAVLREDSVPLCGAVQTIRFRADAAAEDRLLADDESLDVAVTQSGSATLDWLSQAPARRAIRREMEGLCVQGLPTWVLAVTAYRNANAQPGRLATYPETRVASGTRRIVDCGAP